MSAISSAVILSDLHLGREKSYLHSSGSHFRENRNAVLDLLRKLGPRTELILNGDLLELSLAGWDANVADLRQFLLLVAEAGPYERIVYIPGNHDHHLWRKLVERMVIDERLRRDENPPGPSEFPRWFVDRRFSSADTAFKGKLILEELWPADKAKPEFVIKYPHHLVKITTGTEQRTPYLITHGHFLEDLFKPVNYLIEPAHLEELEAFNNLWLEAFDYHLGHAGRLSARVNELVARYEQGGQQARRTVKKILIQIHQNLGKKVHLRWPYTWLILYGMKILVKKVPAEKQSGLFAVALDAELKTSIAGYVQKYVLQRYRKGKASFYSLPADKDIPTPFTFIFGHTHRPVFPIAGKAPEVRVGENEIPILNTGGWIREEREKPEGKHAGILKIDVSGAQWESMEGKLA